MMHHGKKMWMRMTRGHHAQKNNSGCGMRPTQTDMTVTDSNTSSINNRFSYNKTAKSCLSMEPAATTKEEAFMKAQSNPRKPKAYRRYDLYLLLLFMGLTYLSLFLRSSSDWSRTKVKSGLHIMDSSAGNDDSLIHLRNDHADGSHRRLSKKDASDYDGKSDYAKYSCEDIYRHPLDAASQCTFAKTCNDGDGILFGSLVFCLDDDDADKDSNNEATISSTMSRTLLLWLVCAPLALLLILLFRILGSTAEEFFSPGLEMLSLRLGLPERFAGVTLLALGNGAPDVASTVSAIRNDHKRGYLLALGELTGTCMVLSTVVVGVVAFVSPRPVPCRGALIRDIVMFIITMILVFATFHGGSIDLREVRSFVGLYLAYVLIVLCADIYHQKLVNPTIASHDAQKEEAAASNNGPHKHQPENIVPSETTSLVAGSNEIAQDEAPPSVPSLIERTVQFFTNYNDNEEAAAEESPEGIPSEQVEAALEEKVSSDLQPPSRHNSRKLSNGWGERDGTGHEPLMVFHPHHGGMVNLKHLESSGDGGESFNGSGSFDEADDGSQHHHHDHHWLEVRYELADYFKSFFQSIYSSNTYTWIDKLLMTLELPITLLRMFSIPVPCDGYYCRPLLALSVTLSPCWLCYYLNDQFDFNILEQSTTTIVVVLVAIPVAIGLLVLRFAPKGSNSPRPLAAVPLTLIGFVVSATWLDLIADKLVRLLSFFAILCHIPSTIMGLTVLAWGNSSQDLIANVTVARKDLSIMAITASFAGPVFNILVGLGLGFAILNTSGEAIPVHLDNPLRIGFLFSLLNGILVIVSGVYFGRGFIPKKYGYVAMVVYFLYVVVSVTI